MNEREQRLEREETEQRSVEQPRRTDADELGQNDQRGPGGSSRDPAKGDNKP